MKRSLQGVILFVFFTGVAQIAPSKGVAQHFDHPIHKDMEFHIGSTDGNCSGCTWIIAEGGIVADTPDKFRQFLASTSSRGTVHLNSPGGGIWRLG